MIKGLVFNQAFWIQKTDDVANKLNNYDNLQYKANNLQNQVNSLQSFKRKVMSINNQTWMSDLGSTGTTMTEVKDDGTVLLNEFHKIG